jgi:hypothetical protein
VGGGGTGAETVGREAALKRGGGAGSVTREWTSGSVTFERLGRRHGREEKKRGEQGGPAAGTPRGAGRVGPGSDRGPAAAHVGGAPLFRQWHTDMADTRALAVGGRGSEKREARRAWASPGRKRSGPSPDE